MKLVCPKCESDNIEWVDSNHQEFDIEDERGYTDAICFCRNCKINFSLWIDFDLSNITPEIDCIWREKH